MYNRKDYKNIYYLLLNNKLGENKKYKDLMPYEYILSYLVKSTLTNDAPKYVEECIKLVRKLGNNLNFVDCTLMDLCFYERNSINGLSCLELIFFPKDIINKYGFGYFLTTFISLFKIYLRSVKKSYPNISFNYSKFNDVFQYAYDLCNDKNFNDEQIDIIVTILAKIYVENLDYDLLETSLIDPDYCMMNNLAAGVWAKGNYYNSYFKKIYDNAENFIDKNRKQIL